MWTEGEDGEEWLIVMMILWIRMSKISFKKQHNQILILEAKKNKNKEQLESLGVKCEGDGGRDVAHVEEIKRSNRQEISSDG